MLAVCLLLASQTPAPSIDAAALGPDLDHDGCPELVLWCRNEQLVVFPRSREAHLAPLPGEPARSPELLRAGDCDGDGAEDWVWLTPEVHYQQGQVHVVSGATGRTIEILAGETLWSRFGAAFARIGDIDHDGCADFAVGAPGGSDFEDTRPGVTGGNVRFVSGRLGRKLRVALGTEAIGKEARGFGGVLAGGLDFDHDGMPDVLVSSDEYAADSPKPRPPVVLLSGADASPLRTYRPPPIRSSCPGMDSAFVNSLAALPDVDGDDVPDVLVGSSEVWYSIELDSIRRTSDRGRAWLLSGKDGRCLQTWTGGRDGEGLGRWVFASGDMDGDAVGDIWILSRGNGTTDCPAGLALISGKTLVPVWSESLEVLLRGARLESQQAVQRPGR